MDCDVQIVNLDCAKQEEVVLCIIKLLFST